LTNGGKEEVFFIPIIDLRRRRRKPKQPTGNTGPIRILPATTCILWSSLQAVASGEQRGDIEVTSSELQVLICLDTGDSTYSFLCPSCRLIVNKPAEQHVGRLVSAGVRVVNWDLPAELSEPKSGPAITYDDLLAFHFELES